MPAPSLPAVRATDPHAAWQSLSREVHAALDTVERGTDFRPTLHRARSIHARLCMFDRWYAKGDREAFRVATAEHGLRTFGPNGMWPAVADLLRQAAYHGFTRKSEAA